MVIVPEDRHQTEWRRAERQDIELMGAMDTDLRDLRDHENAIYTINDCDAIKYSAVGENKILKTLRYIVEHFKEAA